MFLPHLVLVLAAAVAPRAGPPPVPGDPAPAAPAVIAARAGWRPAPRVAPANLFTLIDYFDEGQRRALDYLDGLPPAAREQFRLADLAPACVRVSCERDGGRSLVSSTGVLVNGGRQIVTAGHAVGTAQDTMEVLSVILADGRQIPVRVTHRSDVASADQDWAILEFAAPVPAGLVSVRVSTARAGGLAFIMGYPERVGLGADGHAVSALSSEPLALDPLLFVARVPLPAGAEFEPVAGALPLSGASGSPVFDEHGALVGVLVAIGRLAYPDGLRHVYRVSPSADFETALGP